MKKPKNDRDAGAGLKMGEPRRMALSELNMAPYNPRTMPPDKMRALKASLLKHGMVLNLVVQKRSAEYGMDNVLIGGHQRVAAMREICAERGWPEPREVPAMLLDVGDADAKQLNVALNNIEGEFDPYKLGAIFNDVFPDMTTDDVLATGFLNEQIEEMRRLVLPPEEQVVELEGELGSMPEFGRSITLSIEFEDVKRRDMTKALLKRLAEERRRKPGAIVQEALAAWSATNPGKKRAGRGKAA